MLSIAESEVTVGEADTDIDTVADVDVVLGDDEEDAFGE